MKERYIPLRDAFSARMAKEDFLIAALRSFEMSLREAPPAQSDYMRGLTARFRKAAASCESPLLLETPQAVAAKVALKDVFSAFYTVRAEQSEQADLKNAAGTARLFQRAGITELYAAAAKALSEVLGYDRVDPLAFQKIVHTRIDPILREIVFPGPLDKGGSMRGYKNESRATSPALF